MVTKVIPVEPYYIYDPPKEEFSIRIDKHLSYIQKRRKTLKKRKARSAAVRKLKKRNTHSELFSEENFESSALLPYIDSAMKLQQNAYECARSTNRNYEPQMLLIFLESFIAIVFNLYYIISVFIQPSAFKLSREETIGYLARHLIQPIICILVIVVSFSLLKYQFRRTQDIVNKLIIHSKNPEVRARFLAFSQQIQANIPDFSIYGFFQLDGSVLFGMVSATTTYLIILVQALGGESEIDPLFQDVEEKANDSSIN